MKCTYSNQALFRSVIAAKELLPVMLAFKLWAVQLKGVNILFLVDNISIVHVLNNKTSKDPIIMKMMRQMVIHAMSNHTDFGSTHIEIFCQI